MILNCVILLIDFGRKQVRTSYLTELNLNLILATFHITINCDLFLGDVIGNDVIMLIVYKKDTDKFFFPENQVTTLIFTGLVCT